MSDTTTSTSTTATSTTAGPTLRPLFGGALVCQIPDDWRDVSDVRQVPDHQECWQDGEGRVWVVEILDRHAAVADAGAAAFFFHDLAQANGATDPADRLFTPAAQPELATRIMGVVVPIAALSDNSSASLCFGTGHQRVALGRDTDLAGNPRAQEDRWIRVELCVIRLASKDTDLLVTLSSPSAPNPQETTNSTPSTGLFVQMLGSLQIRDWSLFG